MKNSKLRKALTLVACAVLLVCLSVGATLAYLTSATEVVKNTFVVGEGIAITLDEAAVYVPEAELEDLTQFGQAIPGADRVMANTYKIVPNWEYDKDPTVHVQKASGDCYVFVKVQNGLAGLEADDIADDPNTDEDETKNVKIATQMAANGWIALDDEPGVYYYKDIILTDNDNVQDLLVFSTFTTKNYESLTDEERTQYTGELIKIDAYAIQADGFAGAAEAWEAGEHEFGF